MSISEIVNNNDTVAGRVFDGFIFFLIILSLFTFSLETLPGLTDEQREYLHYSEIVISILFTIEYVLRIFTAEKKTSYIFSFYGFIDLMAILPFYLVFLGVDLYVIRALRVLRIVKLTRYSVAMIRLGKAFAIAKGEVVVFLLATLVLLYLAAVGVYIFESRAQPENFVSVFDGMWWAVASLTTVGYGDIYPVTMGGKLFTFIVLIFGLGIVAAPAGIISSALTQVRSQEKEEEKERKDRESRESESG